MFLQDFDLHFVHIPGSDMGPADALSRLTDPDISSDNTNVTLLPDDLFICAIDTALVDKITSSTPTDPLVLNALQSLSVGSPLFPCSSFANWHFLILVFTLKTISTYLPSPGTSSSPQFTRPLLLAMGGSSAHIPCCLGTTGGWVCLPLSAVFLLGVPFASR